MANGSPPDVRATEVDTADWPVQAADLIERTVERVRDLTTGRAILAARAVVYGLFALLVGVAVVVMLVIFAVRLLDAYLPDAVVGEDHTWVAHLLVGGVLSVAGWVLWTRRTDRSAPGAE